MKAKVEKEGETWLILKLQRSHPSNFHHAARFHLAKDTEEKLYEKFQCYCKKNIAETDQSLKTNQEKLPPLQKTLESTESWPIVRITPETRQSCCEETLQKM